LEQEGEMISKKQKLNWVDDVCGYLGEPIGIQPMRDAIRQDIEDAERLRAENHHQMKEIESMKERIKRGKP